MWCRAVFAVFAVCVFWCAVGYWWLWYCSVVSKGGAPELLVSAVFGGCGMVSKGALVSAVFGSCGTIVWVLLDGALWNQMVSELNGLWSFLGCGAKWSPEQNGLRS